MATMYVIAGFDGAGKTHWYDVALQNGWLPDTLSFISVDKIVADELGEFSHENLDHANWKAASRTQAMLDLKQSVIVESDLSLQKHFDYVHNIIQSRRYKAELIYIGTDHLSINLQRTLRRGHLSKEAITPERFERSQALLKENHHLFVKSYFYDNSTELPELCATFKKGELLRISGNHNWVIKFAENSEKLSKQLQNASKVLRQMQIVSSSDKVKKSIR